MDFRSIKEAAFIARFIHIVILAVVVALGVHYRSGALVAGLTAVWFVLMAVIYLLLKRRNRQHRAS